MLNKTLIAGLLIVLGPTMAWAQVAVTGAPGASLKRLEGTPTLVTVVLKPNGAEDPNLQILDVHRDGIVVLTEKGEPIPYLYDSIMEVRVQGGKIEKREIQLKEDVLPKAEQEIVNRALARAFELYYGKEIEQELKLHLAAILLVAGEEGEPTLTEDRIPSVMLEGTANSNDIESRLDANLAQYLAKGPDMIDERLIRTGFESGIRKVRGTAAKLAGLANAQSLAPTLSSMMQDRTPEVASPAAKALGRMNYREAIPYLISVIGSTSGGKGDAAAWALGQMGGENLISQLKLRLSTATGLERFRIARVLYTLNDPLGRKLLMETMRDVPTLRHDAAIVVAWKEGEWDAKEILRTKLQKREDVNDRNLVSRAKTAGALVAGGDPQAKAVMQELLRGESEAAREQVFEEITRIGDHRLLSLLRSSIENADTDIAVQACRAAVSIGYPAYRERLIASWD